MQHDVAGQFESAGPVQLTALRLTQKQLVSARVDVGPKGYGTPEYALALDAAGDGFWVLTQEKVHRPGDPADALPWDHHEWLRHDFSGALLEVRNADGEPHALPGPPLAPAVELGWTDGPRKDAGTLVAFTKFKRKHLISSSFNPLHGWGDPTGGGPRYRWAGTAHFVLHLGAAELRFAAPARVTGEGTYDFHLDAYRLPAEVPTVLLHLRTRLDAADYPGTLRPGLYLLRCADCCASTCTGQ